VLAQHPLRVTQTQSGMNNTAATATQTTVTQTQCKDCGGRLTQAFGTTKAYDRCTRCGHVFPASR
jgi:ribosomal protein S27E